MVLYINCCVRKESRTNRLAKALLSNLGGEYTELILENEPIEPLTERVLAKRTELIAAGEYSGFSYAKQFADADTIVIAAPYWDLSFPAKLKVYLENIYVTGVVSRYDENGRPEGLCKAKKVYYVTTAGGKFVPDFSFAYLRELCVGYLGIGEAELICAEGLDIAGNDAEEILNRAIADLPKE